MKQVAADGVLFCRDECGTLDVRRTPAALRRRVGIGLKPGDMAALKSPVVPASPGPDHVTAEF